jgi:hypothetical protein
MAPLVLITVGVAAPRSRPTRARTLVNARHHPLSREAGLRSAASDTVR